MAVDDELLARLDRLLEKGEQVIQSSMPMMYSDDAMVHKALFSEFRVGSEAFIVGLLGEKHVYSRQFSEVKEALASHTQNGMGILRSLREEVQGGYLRTVRALVAAEIFIDFLDMADHLLEAGYKDPAASLTGALLEDGLRRLCRSQNITVKARDDLDSMSARLADADAYNRHVQRKVKVWTGIRNHADHGEFDEYSARDVEEMVTGVREFLADHAA